MGTEADVLPYMTGGYGSVWYATGHLRYRAVVTRVTTRTFMLKDQFTDNRMMVYTLWPTTSSGPTQEAGGWRRVRILGRGKFAPS